MPTAKCQTAVQQGIAMARAVRRRMVVKFLAGVVALALYFMGAIDTPRLEDASQVHYATAGVASGGSTPADG